MDNNNVGNTERLTRPDPGAGSNPGSSPNPGENPYSFSTPQTDTAQSAATGTHTVTGTYNASNTGTYYPSDTGMAGNTYNAGMTGSTMSPAEEAYAKKAKSGMIMGIVSLVLNLIFCCIPFLTDWVFSPGYLFIILEIAGIQNSVQGRKSVEKKGMATAGLVMNIVSLAGSILLIILVMVLKFSDILD